jgi:hypothetical protein
LAEGIGNIEESIKDLPSIKSPIYNFWGPNLGLETHQIHVYCKDEDVTHLFRKVEGAYQNGLFTFMLEVGTWDETRQGKISIVLPPVIQYFFWSWLNTTVIGSAIISTGEKASEPSRLYSIMTMTRTFNNLWAVEIGAPAYEHPPKTAPNGILYADLRPLEVTNTRKDVPFNWHYIQEGGLIFGSINLLHP